MPCLYLSSLSPFYPPPGIPLYNLSHPMIVTIYLHSHSSIFMCTHSRHIKMHSIVQMITQPPESTTVALGTNATFSCRGIGSVLWQINGTQVQAAGQVPVFASAQVFVPLPRDNFSELIVTATRETNATLMIICAVNPFSGVEAPVESDLVQLFVYGEYNVDRRVSPVYCLPLSSLTGQILLSPSFPSRKRGMRDSGLRNQSLSNIRS